MDDALAVTYIEAQTGSEAAKAELAALLADGVVLQTNRASFRGREEVMSQVGTPLVAPNFRMATWESRREDGRLVLSGKLPLEALIGGIDIRIDLDDRARVQRIEQLNLSAPPLPPSPVHLSPEVKQSIAAAWRNATVLVIGVDPSGEARPTLRGTVQGYGDDSLAFWARNPEGGTLSALAANPKLTFFYREAPQRTTLTFYGNARVVSEGPERQAVYDNSPEPERAADPEMRGAAVIAELYKVEGTYQGLRVRMQRGV